GVRRPRLLLWGALAVALTALVALAQQRLLGAAAGGALTFTRAGNHYELLWPRVVALLFVAPVLVLVLARSLADLPLAQRLLALVARLAFIALLALAVGRLVRTEEAHDVALVLLVDVSDSVPEEALGDAKKAVERYYAQRGPKDRVRLVTFAARPRLV